MATAQRADAAIRQAHDDKGKAGMVNVNPSLSMQAAYDGSSNMIYQGWAAVGSLPSAVVWRIRKLTYVSDNLTEIGWANSSDRYDFEWDERTTYTYA